MAIINFNSISGINTVSVASSITVGNNVAISTNSITATSFTGALTGNVTGNLTGNLNSSGVSTITTLQTGAIQTTAGKPILNSTGSILQVSWKNLGGGNWSATTTSATYSTVTGYTNTITPSSTSSKILHIVTIGAYMVCDGSVAIGRGGSVISPSLLDSYRDVSASNYMNDMPPFTFTWLDSPATTSAITYQLYARATGCGGYMFIGSSSDFDASWTLMEVSA